VLQITLTISTSQTPGYILRGSTPVFLFKKKKTQGAKKNSCNLEKVKLSRLEFHSCGFQEQVSERSVAVVCRLAEC
jgi:hypothetical protein